MWIVIVQGLTRGGIEDAKIITFFCMVFPCLSGNSWNWIQGVKPHTTTLQIMKLNSKSEATYLNITNNATEFNEWSDKLKNYKAMHLGNSMVFFFRKWDDLFEFKV